MLKIAVIGGGSHSRCNHLPALARYVSLYPAEFEPAAFCDLQREVAERVSQEYGETWAALAMVSSSLDLGPLRRLGVLPFYLQPGLW